MDFSTYCNVCLDRKTLKNICLEESKKIVSILMSVIDNADIIYSDNIFICDVCYEKFENYSQFKQLCIINLIHFRQAIFNMKLELEVQNDPDIKNKLENFVNGRVSKQIDSSLIGGSNSVEKTVAINKKMGGEDVSIEEVVIKQEKNDSSDGDDEICGSNTYLGEEDIDKPIKQEDIIKGQFPLEKSIDEVPYLGNDEKSNNISNICGENTDQVDPLDVSGIITPPKRLQTEDLPYKCNVCEKSFKFPSVLERHVVIHSSERPKKVYTGPKPFKCNICKKAFISTSHLKRHERVHTGETPYVCKVCKKGFKQSPQLIVHLRTHTGDRPYKCTACEKSFTRSFSLVKHLRTHTGEKPYKCDVCEKTFSDPGNFRKHKRIHNSEKNFSICLTPDNSNSLT